MGERGGECGGGDENLGRVAKIWLAVVGCEVTVSQGALCMAGLKIARLTYDNGDEDGWADLAGYAACGGEVTRPDDL